MSAARVVLWRHGRTSYNAAGRFQGQLDVPLDAVGTAQAARSAAVLAEELRGQRARLVTSDLTRAATTLAELVVLDPRASHVEEDLREIHGGSWQGLADAEIAQRWPREWAAYRSGDTTVRAGGTGEDLAAVGERVAAVVRRQAQATPDGAVLVLAGHGAAIRAGVAVLLGAGDRVGALLSSLGNARWATLRPAGQGWTLTGYDLGPRGAVPDQDRLDAQAFGRAGAR